MKTNEVLVIALVAIFAFAGAFVASYMVPAASAQPQENGLGPYRDYVMKVAPIEPTFVTEGTLYFKVQAGQNLFSKELILQQLEQTNPNYAVPNGRVDPLEITANFAPISGERTFTLGADGSVDTQLPAGIYSGKIADGNGGQPEFILFAIKPTQTLMMTALGHAISGAEPAEPRIVITRAIYGAYVTVVDHEAVPAVPAVPGTPAAYVNVGHNNGNYDRVPAGHGQFVYQYVGSHHGDYNYVPAVPGTPAIPAIPAVTHVEGHFIDVTAEVQAAVDAGVTQFRFNNAMNPGGIFDVDGVLIQQIADPAYGIVKDVTIEYAGVTIDTQEYQLITL